MNKNVILCFSSLHPEGLNNSQIYDREKNYNLSLSWLLKIIPNNWDIIYNDNTIYTANEIYNQSLKNNLTSGKINLLLHNTNAGSQNKGAGEQDMCKKCFKAIDFSVYNWLVYYTARHIIPNSWYFDNLETIWDSFDAVMSNPSFFYLNFVESPPTEKLYNDMIFSMKYNIFKNFVDSINVEELKRLNKNSENHLFEFINNNKINRKELEYLGILRNDTQSHGWHLI